MTHDFKYRRSLLCFRRDLRIADNTALNQALQLSESVLPCFVFDPIQTSPHQYRSENGLKFLLESLGELSGSISVVGGALYLGVGKPCEILEQLIETAEIEAIFVNQDYTPYSRKRDKEIEEMCTRRGIDFHSIRDALLLSPLEFAKPDGKPYTVFTPFFKRGAQISVAKPSSIPPRWTPLPKGLTSTSLSDFTPASPAKQPAVIGGRKQALAVLSRIFEYRDYITVRDLPAIAGTTKLSAHLKFGTISVREAYWTIANTVGSDHALIRELYWRDFFTHIGWHFPHVFQGAFHHKYDRLAWETDAASLAAWQTGMTGFPIVDAGMREIVTTGFMHNRVRMIVASFLVKDLHISWREGEKFFAHHLVDYDPAVNNGNWQWAASTGCDAQPYFRIFNPWLQQKKFDPDCVYIKRWIPELRSTSVADIHDADGVRPAAYPHPIINHAEEKEVAEEMFQDVKG